MIDSQSNEIIRLENITKRFPGVVALDKINLSVIPGEVHAIIGENGAGKSTLMNILAGELQPDEGTIYFKGSAVQIPNPHASRSMGISVVFQELALCPNLSVAENISLWQASQQSLVSVINRKAFAARADTALADLGIEDLNTQTPVGRLSVAKQQLVEIAKSISTNAPVLILDEPNSALTLEESEHLFQIVRQLRQAGVAVLYISHHLEDVLTLADRITVLRDGKLIESLPGQEATINGLIALMVGRNITTRERETKESDESRTALELRELSGPAGFQDISFSLHAGEIVGIAGLPDSHKDELVDGIFGLTAHNRGEIQIAGRSAHLRSPLDAILRGMFLIPADRRGAGAFLQMKLHDNIIASSLRQVTRTGVLQNAKARKISNLFYKKLDIRAASLNQMMANLSGGNQQKVILARGLATNPKILILHEPTRGIDVGAKAEIYQILQELASQGTAILIISSELPELISQCDRILVMFDGRIAGEFLHHEATEEGILACAMGQSPHR